MGITLLGITFITFLIMNLAPRDPLQMKLMFSEGMSPEQFSRYEQDTKPVIQLPTWYKKFSYKTNRFFLQAHPKEIWFADHQPLAALRNFLGQETVGSIIEDRFIYKGLNWVGEKTVFYMKWLRNLLRLDFGLSEKDKRPVLDKIKEAVPYTLVLNILTISLVYMISVPLGMWSALKKDSFLDKVVMVKLFFFYSLPGFWLATMLLVFFAGGEYFNLFPLQGFESDFFREQTLLQKLINPFWYIDVGWHLFLPVLAETLGSFAFLTRFSRNNFLDVLTQDYIRTARAKGLSENRVLFKHVLRNSLIPFVTLMGSLLPALLGGSVIVEQIFAIPGMGMLSFEAVLGGDQNVIMGIATIGALLTLIGLFISDMLYVVVDPRIRFEK